MADMDENDNVGSESVVSDPFAALKARQRDTWALGDFGEIAVFTTMVAGHLVRFAGIGAGQHVLDIGTGTGVVAITVRRTGARVTGLDFTPSLLARAKENALVAGTDDIVWREGDAEVLPFADGSFDVVISQFGHMFAPRPEVVTAEMLRVLAPGGTIAFATWPPDQLVGRLFALNAKYLPPPVGVPSPAEWGDVAIIAQRLGDWVRDLSFERGVMAVPALSLAHHRFYQESNAGSSVRTVQTLGADGARLAAWRAEGDELVEQYFRENVVRHEYLLTRATRVLEAEQRIGPTISPHDQEGNHRK